ERRRTRVPYQRARGGGSVQSGRQLDAAEVVVGSGGLLDSVECERDGVVEFHCRALVDELRAPRYAQLRVEGRYGIAMLLGAVGTGERGIARAMEDGRGFGVVGDEEVAGASQERPQGGYVTDVVKPADGPCVVAER